MLAFILYQNQDLRFLLVSRDLQIFDEMCIANIR